MSWITPLGFLGLLGIAVLILIYILKPNYQQKIVSSTHVWKLSLKYRKKRIPINKFRNLLIFLCQLLIITACAFLLAQPIIKAEEPVHFDEKVAVIDGSASMLASYDNETRFSRAVGQVKELAEETMAQGGVMTVILAGKEATFVAQRLGADAQEELYAAIDALAGKETQCTYGVADVDGAMRLAEEVLRENEEVDILLYSATNYIDKGSVEWKDVSVRDEEGNSLEWNAAILNGVSSLEDNYYVFTVDVACYGRSSDLMVYCTVYGANGTPNAVEQMNSYVRCDSDETQTVEFKTKDLGKNIYSYDYVHIRFWENNSSEFSDSFVYDDQFFLYGGTKQDLKMEYCSSLANTFFGGIAMDLRDILRSRWDIDYTEIQTGIPEIEGYDVYIFEHTMPETMPTDGMVILVDPDKAPEGSGLVIEEESQTFSEYLYLTPGDENPITSGFAIDELFVTEYRRVTYSEGYQPLIYCGGDPVLLIKNDMNAKIAVLALNVNSSNASMAWEFSVLMLRLLNYFLPSTITDYSFEVDETVTLNARGPVLNVSGPGANVKFESFPAELSLSVPGTYTLTQTILRGTEVTDYFYVKIPASESNILREYDSLAAPFIERQPKPVDEKLLIYFASALVALLFAEWWLQSKENF